MYLLMAVVFVLGYLAIAFEHNIHVDKAASALLTAILVWTLLVFGADTLLASHLTEAGTTAGHGASQIPKRRASASFSRDCRNPVFLDGGDGDCGAD